MTDNSWINLKFTGYHNSLQIPLNLAYVTSWTCLVSLSLPPLAPANCPLCCSSYTLGIFYLRAFALAILSIGNALHLQVILPHFLQVFT